MAASKPYGTDAGAAWIGSTSALGYCHSADLPGDHGRPYSDPASGLAITADIRIDNRQDLAAALGIGPAELVTWTDARLVLHAWLKWKHDCPHHLYGDFAFAIWDEVRRTLFCARDHAGARPFYYSLSPDRFVFASAIRGVTAVPGISHDLDERHVVERLSGHGVVDQQATYLAGVRKLLPGHTLTVTQGHDRLMRYWRLEEAPEVRFTTSGEYADAARALVSQSVNDRLRTTHAVGVHLSGGLDSSAVAVLAGRDLCRRGQAPPVAFGRQPPPGITSGSRHEHDFVQALSTNERMPVVFCPATLSSLIDVLRMDAVFDCATGSLAAERVIQAAAAERGVRLILSGLGGDEGISFKGHRHTWLDRVRTRLELLRPQPARVKPSFLSRDLAPYAWASRQEHQTPTARTKLLRLWEHGPSAGLESWHAHGAAYRVRYAYPLLDRRLLEFVAGIPDEQFTNGRTTRWLMRRAMRGILPPALLDHTDKTDPARSTSFRSVVRRAMVELAPSVEACAMSSERRRYLDFPRLLAAMRSDADPASGTYASAIAALLFLDF